jgi:type I restriction enzyme S subunit
VHSLQSGYLERLAIPLPPIAEQRRTIDLLSRAENIVRMRKEAEAKAKEIIPALFLDMFKDPGTNPSGERLADSTDHNGRRRPQQFVRLGDVVAKLEGGKNLQAGANGE